VRRFLTRRASDLRILVHREEIFWFFQPLKMARPDHSIIEIRRSKTIIRSCTHKKAGT
jgi:hypothetical protein